MGLGWWSDELAQAIQRRSEAIAVVSCYSRSAAKRAAFSEKFDAARHDSHEAVLANPEIDAVILTTPHSLHAEHVTQAAAAKRCLRAIEEGKTASVNGVDVEVGSDCIYEHSDTPNAFEVAKAVREAVKSYLDEAARWGRLSSAWNADIGNQKEGIDGKQVLSPPPGTFYGNPAPGRPLVEIDD